MAPLVKRFDSLVTQRGDTIHIPNLSNLTATSKSANVQVTLQAPTETDTTISLNQHYESSFLVEDILKVQSNYKSKDIVASASNCCRKQREFGGHLKSNKIMTTPSRNRINTEGVETMYFASLYKDDDIVRSYVKA